MCQALVPVVMLLWAGLSGESCAGKVPLGLWAAHGGTRDQLRIQAAPDQETGILQNTNQVWLGKIYVH